MPRLVKKSTGEGIVCAIGKGSVFVAPLGAPLGLSARSEKSCGGANGCGGCGGCVPVTPIPYGGYAGRIRIRVNDAGGFRPGDRVRYAHYVPEPNLAGLLAFGTPTALSIIVILYIAIRTPPSIESPAALIAAAVAFIVGIVIIGILDRLFKMKYPSSIIDGGGEDGS